jgi:hypothetical protein
MEIAFVDPEKRVDDPDVEGDCCCQYKCGENVKNRS